MLWMVTGSTGGAAAETPNASRWKRRHVLLSEALESMLDLAVRSLMRSSTNADSPSVRREEIASEADPRLTLRTTGASDLVNVLGVGGLEALLQKACVPSGPLADAAGAVLLSSEGAGRSLFSFASIGSVTDACCRGTCLRWLERLGGIARSETPGAAVDDRPIHLSIPTSGYLRETQNLLGTMLNENHERRNTNENVP